MILQKCILIEIDGVTNVLFTTAPSSVLDSDAPRPFVEFSQLKRHLVTAEENATVEETSSNVINIRLRGRKVWHIVSLITFNFLASTQLLFLMS
jgi:hypothetical protein